MEKSANTISQRKFSKLSARRQHELLAALASEALSGKTIDTFLKRYDELHSWARLDRYAPPVWLSQEEALEEYFVFHAGLTFSPNELPQEDLSKSPVSWQPCFAVEVVLDQVRSPYNVGSIIRIIDNFGFKGLVHSSAWLRMDHPQLCKAARGCQKWIPVRFEPDLISYLKQALGPVIGIENNTGAVPVTGWDVPKQSVLVLGNETYGIAAALRRLCDQTVSIPMFGYKKSMNVHHALAIIAQKFAEKQGSIK
jgi:tRNA G18 (ribose-2'-O)-methylase SpoU